MSTYDWFFLWLGRALLALSHVLQARRIDRLRETLRRNGIHHDDAKPWEGA